MEIRRQSGLVLAFVVLLAMAFQGSRGLWEPDEGFYANAALSMVDHLEPLLPRLNGEPFLDKPPLIYWTAAAGALVAGRSEWGLRLGHAAAFVLTSLLAGLAARRFAGTDALPIGMLAYATMTMPFLAANVLTPDTPLALALALACYGLLRVETEVDRRDGLYGWLAAGLGFGLAILTKGPVALAFAAAVLLHRLISGRLLESLRDVRAWAGVALACGLGGSWYLWLFISVPGSASYVLDSQVLGRLASDHLARNPGFRGLVRVYLPAALLGFLPWSIWAIRALPQSGEVFGERGTSRRKSVHLFLCFWLLVPTLVFCLAQSRLPLYLLPLAFPVVVAAAPALAVALRSRDSRRRVAITFVATGILLLGLKAFAAFMPAYRDTRGFARALDAVLPPDFAAGVHDVVAVDVNRNGLPLYTPWPVEWVTTDPSPYPFFVPPESFDVELEELAGCPRSHIVLASDRAAPEVAQRLAAAGQRCDYHDLAGYHPVLFCRPGSSQESGKEPG